MPKLSAPGAVLIGDAAGMMNLTALKGVHYAIKSGMLAAEAIYASLKAGTEDFSSYEEAVADSIIGKDLYKQRNARQPFQKGLLRGMPLVGMVIMTGGHIPGVRWKLDRNDCRPRFVGDSKDSYPTPDGRYTFDKLSSVFISGNTTRDDAPNHIRIHRNVPRELAAGWKYVCSA